MQQNDLVYKVLVVGEYSVGKTNITTKFVHNTFNPLPEATIGVDFANTSMEIEGKTVDIQIWDTAGQERFQALAKPAYRGALGALLVYDITRASSLKATEKWLDNIRNFAEPNCVVVLIGNKCDLHSKREVATEEGKEFAKKHSLMFMETSALDGENIQEAWRQLVSMIHENKAKAKVKSNVDSDKPKSPNGDGKTIDLQPKQTDDKTDPKPSCFC
eukprot:TRINITY_DN6743_c0_g1_i1.p1 TRINITY_DN6743_c0_g1~~TRINITY_DN6743_c0_g1_i1.p1  ORF type:complete len:246 (-),score=67.09 TRINITY_DN6743_c0_g1_i1:25-672(-)